jgi:ketosteroid isomerase-like protein
MTIREPHGTGTDPEADPVTGVALEAWRRLGEGHRTGDFGPYLAMLDDAVTIRMPVGDYREPHIGRAAAAEYYEMTRKFGVQLSFSEPSRVTRQDDTVVIEFNDQGTIAGEPYFNRVAAVFQVRGERIVDYREYFGSIDSATIARMEGR